LRNWNDLLISFAFLISTYKQSELRKCKGIITLDYLKALSWEFRPTFEFEGGIISRVPVYYTDMFYQIERLQTVIDLANNSPQKNSFKLAIISSPKITRTICKQILQLFLCGPKQLD